MQRAIVATVALAAAFLSTMAHGQQAVLDLYQTGRAGVLSFSVETLSNASDKTITVDGETYYAAWDREIAMFNERGVNGRDGRQVFSRFDFENIVFLRAGGSPVRGLIGIPAIHNHTLEAGGTNGSSWAVLSLPANLTYTAADAILTYYIHAAIRPDAPGTITYTVYIDVGDALLGKNPLHTQKRTVFFPVRSLKDEVTPGAATTTVASNFTQLAAAGANAIGTLSIAVGDDREGYAHYTPISYRARGGDPWSLVEVDSLTDIAKPGDAAAGTGSLTTFRGDFSVGTFYANAAAAASCGTAPLTTKGPNDKVLEKVTVAAAEGVTALCVAVPATNTAEIPEGEYTVAVDYEGLTNAAFPPLDLAETSIGRIRRDGTRVQIPYLTTFSGYRQNVVIVNRNTKPVAYTFKFVAEEGVAATPGAMAEGMVPAQGRAVLKATDIVSLAGKTRTAATLDVVAASGTVDVATVQVNMNDKGTDTVLLESMAN